MRIALDPYMHRRLSLDELPRKAAELGYEWIELSPRADFLDWRVAPRVYPERIRSFKKALSDHGVKIASLLPMYRWASPHEDERRAAVGYWKKAIQVAVDMVRVVDSKAVRFLYCAPHTFYFGDGMGKMIRECGDALAHVHVADTYNHKASSGLRYICNPPGAQVTVHQHMDIGDGEIAWDEFFSALAAIGFDGVMTACVFAWEERADESGRFMRQEMQKYVDKYWRPVSGRKERLS